METPVKNRISALTAMAVAAGLALSACGSDAKEDSQSKAAGNGDKSMSKVDAKSATSLKDFGSMEELVKAAEAEGALNTIALPHNWANYGKVIEAFKAKYPKIKVNEANPDASSKEEIDAIKTNAGTDKAPDTVDVGIGVASTSTQYFAPYKVQAWDAIPDAAKESNGLYYGDYTGIMSIGWNKTKYGEIKGLDDLTDARFKGTVALNGKPAEAGAAFNGFLMANLASGGDLNNLQPGLDYFKKLKQAGTLTTIDVTDATIQSGQTGVVMDWSYNQVGYAKKLKAQGVDWEYMVIPGSEVAQYYNQAINKQAPHPAAARLWQEFLYSPEAQNIWLSGGATPILLDKMEKDGTVDKATLDQQIKLSKAPLTYTQEDAKRITEWLASNWDKAIGN